MNIHYYQLNKDSESGNESIKLLYTNGDGEASTIVVPYDAALEDALEESSAVPVPTEGNLFRFLIPGERINSSMATDQNRKIYRLWKNTLSEHGNIVQSMVFYYTNKEDAILKRDNAVMKQQKNLQRIVENLRRSSVDYDSSSILKKTLADREESLLATMKNELYIPEEFRERYRDTSHAIFEITIHLIAGQEPNFIVK